MAQTIPTTNKIIRNTPIKIPAKLLRLASGSSVAVDTNQVPSVNPLSANMKTDILPTVSQTLPLTLLRRISDTTTLLILDINSQKFRSWGLTLLKLYRHAVKM